IVARACVTRRPAGAADVDTTMGCGWYECIDDHNTAAMLLEAVRAYARHEGYSTLIGPINGSTWHRYRFADPSTSPPFFLDVHNKPWYVSQWRENGMHEIAEFASTIFDGLASYGDADPRLQKQRDGGIVLRQIRVDDIENELRAIHSISIEGFKDNYLYSPISVDDFMALYRPVIPLVRPELVLIAENAEAAPVGFVFAVDNIVERTRRSLVMKSAAVLPAYRGIGLGHHLLETVHRSAHESGYDQIIHALMHQTNRSTAILSDRAQPYRTYRLFACEL
ncbi:MAG: GNAT family N-acetyltransferase, partial [bacterium]|nr:GNAT family N-acetyltransferase [Candidatus Kapabacteria bacterium]